MTQSSPAQRVKEFKGHRDHPSSTLTLQEGDTQQPKGMSPVPVMLRWVQWLGTERRHTPDPLLPSSKT